MKTLIKIMFFALTALLITSCKDSGGEPEDNQGNNQNAGQGVAFTESNLVGKWICKYETCSEGSSYSVQEDYSENDWIEFYDDGSAKFISTKNSFLEWSSGREPTLFHWRIEGNQLVTDRYGYSEYQIVKLTANTLCLRMKDKSLELNAYFEREKDDTPIYSSTLTESNLIGRWALIEYYDSYELDPNIYKITNQDLKEGKYMYYMDLEEGGNGYLKTPGGQIVLCSSTTRFSWFLKNKTMMVALGYSDNYEYDWQIESFDGSIIKFKWYKNYAIFKRDPYRSDY